MYRMLWTDVLGVRHAKRLFTASWGEGMAELPHLVEDRLHPVAQVGFLGSQ